MSSCAPSATRSGGVTSSPCATGPFLGGNGSGGSPSGPSGTSHTMSSGDTTGQVAVPSCPPPLHSNYYHYYPHQLNHPFQFHGNNGTLPLTSQPTLVSYPVGLGGSFPPAFVTLPGGGLVMMPPLTSFYPPPTPGAARVPVITSTPQPPPPPPPTLLHQYQAASGSLGSRSPPPPLSPSPRTATAVATQSLASTPYQVSAASTPSQASPVFAPLQPSNSSHGGMSMSAGGSLPHPPQPLQAATHRNSPSLPLGRHSRNPSSGGESDSSRGYRRNQVSKPRMSLLRSRGELNTAKGNGTAAAAAAGLAVSGNALTGKASCTLPVSSMRVGGDSGLQRHEDSFSDGASPSDTHGGGLVTTAAKAVCGTTSSISSTPQCAPLTAPTTTTTSTNTTATSHIPVAHCALDEHRIHQRQKQIRFGKVTAGYRNFRLAVPTFSREVGNDQHPETPKTTTECSKRRWDAIVATWRRTLHAWDDAQEAEAQQFFTQRPMLKTRSELGLEPAVDEEEYRLRTEADIEAIRHEVALLYPTAGTEASDAPHGVSETEGAASPALPMRKHHHSSSVAGMTPPSGSTITIASIQGTNGASSVESTIRVQSCDSSVVVVSGGGGEEEAGSLLPPMLPQLILPPAATLVPVARASDDGGDDGSHADEHTGSGGSDGGDGIGARTEEQSQRITALFTEPHQPSCCGTFEFSVIDEWRTPPVAGDATFDDDSRRGNGNPSTSIAAAAPTSHYSITTTTTTAKVSLTLATSPIRPHRGTVGAGVDTPAALHPGMSHEHVPVALPHLIPAAEDALHGDAQVGTIDAVYSTVPWILGGGGGGGPVNLSQDVNAATALTTASTSNITAGKPHGRMATMMTLMSQSSPKAPIGTATERRHAGAGSPSRPRTGSGGNATHGGLVGLGNTGVLHRHRPPPQPPVSHPAAAVAGPQGPYISSAASGSTTSSSPVGKALPPASCAATEATCTSPWYRGASASPWYHAEPSVSDASTSALSSIGGCDASHIVCLTVITLEGGTTTPSSTRVVGSGGAGRRSQSQSQLANPPQSSSSTLVDQSHNGDGGAAAPHHTDPCTAPVVSFSTTPASGLVTPSSWERGREVWYFDVRHNPSEILRSLSNVYHSTERLTFVDPPHALPLSQPVTAAALFSPEVTERTLMTIEDVSRWLEGVKESEQGAVLLHRGKWRGEYNGMTYDAMVEGLDSGPPSLVDPAPVAALVGAHTPPKRHGAALSNGGGTGAAQPSTVVRPIAGDLGQGLPSSFAIMGSFALSPANASMIGGGCGNPLLPAAAEVSSTASFAAEGITLQHFSFSPTGVAINASPLPSTSGAARLSATALSSTADPSERSAAVPPAHERSHRHVGAGAVASYEGSRDTQTPLEHSTVSGAGVESVTPPNLMLRLAQLGPGESS